MVTRTLVVFSIGLVILLSLMGKKLDHPSEVLIDPEQLTGLQNYTESDARAYVVNVTADCSSQSASSTTFSALKYCADAMLKAVYLSECFGWRPHSVATRSMELHRQAANLANDPTIKDELLAKAKSLASLY